MSLDVKIQNICEDVINWERLSFQNDRRTLNLSYPVSSVASLRLRINNVVQNKNTYTVYMDNTSLTEIPKSYVYLKKVCKSYNPLVEVRYTTIKTYCPRCAGLRYIDDFRYNVDGDVRSVNNELFLIQTLEKHIVTQISSNKYHTWIGTTLHELVKNKITDMSYIESKIKDDIVKAVNDLKKLQAQYQKTKRPVTKGELFGQLLDVVVQQDAKEPTTVHALVKFTAQSGKTLEYEQLFEFTELRRRSI